MTRAVSTPTARMQPRRQRRPGCRRPSRRGRSAWLLLAWPGPRTTCGPPSAAFSAMLTQVRCPGVLGPEMLRAQVDSWAVSGFTTGPAQHARCCWRAGHASPARMLRRALWLQHSASRLCTCPTIHETRHLCPAAMPGKVVTQHAATAIATAAHTTSAPVHADRSSAAWCRRRQAQRCHACSHQAPHNLPRHGPHQSHAC